eukprot:scaffold1087_cov136-Cylindrotheca_fusiformis.AAC.21
MFSIQVRHFWLSFCLLLKLGHAFSTLPTQDTAWKTHILENSDGETLARCIEFLPEDDRPDEDELEMMYPTIRRHFAFDGGASDEHFFEGKILCRQTSFGCGKLGHQIWPASIALSAYLCSRPELIKNKSVMELGAGCGLPSAVCRDVLQASYILATDFWMVGDFEKDRLIPENWHGVNLEFNVATTQRAKVQQVDWFNPDTVRQALQTCQPNIVVGSDLVYYPADLEPFWNTIDICLKEGDVDQILLVSPLKPETREALPEFRKLLEAKGADAYDIKMEELTMHCNEIENSADSFLAMNIAMKK